LEGNWNIYLVATSAHLLVLSLTRTFICGPNCHLRPKLSSPAWSEI